MNIQEFAEKDSWFHIHLAPKITQEFLDWWIEFYGLPGDYDTSEDNLHEYYVRCAFAWHGWNGRKS